ncbi:hypothetical protein CW304_16720 [Bacillus sp. UFRGS-B20]|nr:hypothetical protein CW304_16720 [Bacillus sp. UFRGS-B20]
MGVTMQVISFKKNCLEHNMETGIVPTDNYMLYLPLLWKKVRDTFIPLVKNSDGLKLNHRFSFGFNKEKYRGELNYRRCIFLKGLI